MRTLLHAVISYGLGITDLSFRYWRSDSIDSESLCT
jgi:hypothetical protein